MPQTVEQFNETARALASLTTRDLNEMTVVALRNRLHDVHITHVERDGKLVKVQSARKAELIKAIEEFCVRQKVIDTSAPELVEINLVDFKNDVLVSLLQHNEGQKVFAGRLYEKLKEYTLSQWDTEKQVWKPDGALPTMLSMELTLWLDAYRTEDGEPLADSTKVLYRSKVLGAMKEAMEGDAKQFFYEQMTTRYWKQFRESVLKQTQHRTYKRNEQHKKNVVERREHNQTINTTSLINFAYKVLSNLDDTSPWYDVSIALTIACGRRIGEIHSTAKFEPVSESDKIPSVLSDVPIDHLLWFSGQLKKRGSGDTKPYVIPTLVPVELVIAGHDWMRRKGKVIESLDKVNKELSANISRRYIQPWYEKHLPNVSNYDRIVSDEFGHNKTQEVKVRTYHRLRDIYGKCAMTSFYSGSPFAYGAVEFMKQVLGHSAEGNQTMSYDVDYVIQEGSVTYL